MPYYQRKRRTTAEEHLLGEFLLNWSTNNSDSSSEKLTRPYAYYSQTEIKKFRLSNNDRESESVVIDLNGVSEVGTGTLVFTDPYDTFTRFVHGTDLFEKEKIGQYLAVNTNIEFKD